MSENNHEQALETRAVTVADPNLSATTNQRLTDELREVVGATEREVPVDRPHRTRGDKRGDAGVPFATSNWLMAMIGSFAAIVVGGIVATAATNSLWWLGLALALDVVGVVVIAMVVIRMTSITERPDATLVAAMQADGVANPEQLFTDLVNEFAVAEGSEDGDGEHRTTAVEDDPVQAASEQQSAMTPTGGRSHAVGPGE